MEESGGTASQMEKLISAQPFAALSPLLPLPARPYSWISEDRIQPTCGVSFQCYTLQTGPLSASKPTSNRRNDCWTSQWGEFGLFAQICIRYKCVWCCLSDLGCSCSHLNESLQLWLPLYQTAVQSGYIWKCLLLITACGKRCKKPTFCHLYFSVLIFILSHNFMIIKHWFDPHLSTEAQELKLVAFMSATQISFTLVQLSNNRNTCKW